jgi:hypothetical protein
MALPKKLYNSLLSLDFMGNTPSLNFQNNSQHVTLIGVFFSLSSIIIAILMSSFTIDSFIHRINPSYSTTIYYNPDILNMTSANFQFYITFQTYDKDTKTYSPIPRSEFIKYPKIINTFEDSNSTLSRTTENMMIECENTTVFKDYNKGFISSKNFLKAEQVKGLQSNSLCLPDNSYLIGSTNSSESSISLIFDMDNLKGRIEEYPNISIKIVTKFMVLTASNFTSPWRRLWQEQTLFPEFDYDIQYDFSLQQFRLTKDQTIFLLPDQLVMTFINPESLTQTLRTKNGSSTTIALNMRKSLYSNETLLRYYSLNDVFQAFGSSFSVFFPLLAILSNILTSRVYKISLLSSIFRFYVNDGDSRPIKAIKQSVLGRDIKGSGIDKHNILLLDQNNYIKSFDKDSNKELQLIGLSGANCVIRSEDDRGVKGLINRSKKRYFRQDLRMLFPILKSKNKDNENLIVAFSAMMKILESKLNIENIVRLQFNFDKLLNLFCLDYERRILETNDINVNKFELESDTFNEDVNLNFLFEKILDSNLNERRNKKLLKYFLNNNY